jgi:hypothetical protein
MSRRGLRHLVVALAAGTLSGCGKSAEQPWEKVYPAIGTVKFKGKKLGGAVVTLVPLDKEVPSSVRPTATTDEDGVFQLGTYSLADGAPAGDYKAVVMHYPIVGSKENPSAGRNDLPRKYSTADSSDLKVTIDEADGDLPTLELN